MRVSVAKMTNVINKISDLTSGDKQVPGILLDLSDGLLKVSYTDGHKAFTEHIDVTTEESDRLGDLVVEFEQLKRAITNCQPSGIIKVEDINFEYKEKVITVSADQCFEECDAEGNVVGLKKLANKKMDLAWKTPDADMKASILKRMDYASIFDSDVTDEYDKKELIDALLRTSVEKGKQIYISSKTQTVFVSNQAHVTSVPLSNLAEMSQEDKDILRADMTEQGTYADEAFEKAVNDRQNRVHFSVILPQNISKAVAGILGKTNADKVYLFTRDRFCNIFIDTEDEHVGIWFEMATASKAHLGALERYNSLGYNTYHLTFIRDFLVDSIKSAVNSTKSEKTQFSFELDEGKVAMVIAAGSASASIADTYKVIADEVVDAGATVDANTREVTYTITNKKLNVSLSVISAMLEQLKTTFISLDLECSADGSTCIRLAEVDDVKRHELYSKMRKETEELCAQQGIEFLPNATPTPASLKHKYRLESLLVKQFTMLAK